MAKLCRSHKRPIEIEVMHFETPEDIIEISQWCGGKVVDNKIAIETLEGTMFASLDDYIIKGIQGEFYPCKPDIFRDSYSYPRPVVKEE